RGGSVVVPDVLMALFSATGDGSLAVTSDAPVSASARVSSRRDEGGYGAFESAVPAGSAGTVPSGTPKDSVGAPQTDTRRTDLLLFNGGTDRAVVTVTAYDEAGNPIGSTDVPVAAGQSLRLPAVIAGLGGGPTDSGRIRVALAGGGGGSVTALVEVIELGTGDVDFAPLR
ncbi:MAG TPA: DUF5719 family protein, partial [Thermoanaerobaculia bacterium]